MSWLGWPGAELLALLAERTSRDKEHQPLLNSTGPNPAGAIRRPAALPQPINPGNSPLRNRPQAQKPPRAGPGTEHSPPVANSASGHQLHPTPYGGPRTDRPSDANTRSVAGGSTTVRSAIASPHFGYAKPSTPNTRQSSALQDRHREPPSARFDSLRPTLAGRARAFGAFGRTRPRSRERDASTPCCSSAGMHLVRPRRRHQRHQPFHKLQPAQLQGRVATQERPPSWLGTASDGRQRSRHLSEI